MVGLLIKVLVVSFGIDVGVVEVVSGGMCYCFML